MTSMQQFLTHGLLGSNVSAAVNCANKLRYVLVGLGPASDFQQQHQQQQEGEAAVVGRSSSRRRQRW